MPCAERIQRQRDKYRYSWPAMLLLGGKYKQARKTAICRDLETPYSQACCQRYILLSMSIVKAGGVAKEKIHFARGFQNMSNCICLHSACSRSLTGFWFMSHFPQLRSICSLFPEDGCWWERSKERRYLLSSLARRFKRWERSKEL
jgi:hypothetical protein